MSCTNFEILMRMRRRTFIVPLCCRFEILQGNSIFIYGKAHKACVARSNSHNKISFFFFEENPLPSGKNRLKHSLKECAFDNSALKTVQCCQKYTPLLSQPSRLKFENLRRWKTDFYARGLTLKGLQLILLRTFSILKKI